MYLYVFLTDLKVKLRQTPPSVPGIAPVEAQFFSDNGSLWEISDL